MRRSPETCRCLFDLMNVSTESQNQLMFQLFIQFQDYIKVRVAIENSSSHLLSGHDPRATRPRTAANELTAAGNEDILTNGLNLMPS